MQYFFEKFFKRGKMMKDVKLFSIGEIAKAIGITRKIILNYEAKGLVQPDKKDGASGNRYYTIDTFTRIRTIRLFQNLGISLDEAREYFNDTSDLQPTIKRLESLRDELNLAIENLRERSGKSEETIAVISIEPQTVYQRTYHSASVAEKTTLLRDTALEAFEKYGTDTTKRMYFTEYAVQEPQKISYCVAVPQNSCGEHIQQFPKLQGISLFHHGSYETIPQKHKKLLQYAKENNITLSGVFRNLYLEGPPQHKDKNKFVTQVIALIR